MRKLDLPERFKTIAIKGGSKPKIKPTPRLVENTAASIQLTDRSLMRTVSAASVDPQGYGRALKDACFQCQTRGQAPRCAHDYPRPCFSV
jgi:hypothetical protein